MCPKNGFCWNPTTDCKIPGVWKVHQRRGSCLESCQDFELMCPRSSSQCHQHSGYTLRDELSCPRKTEAQIMSSGRKVVFMTAELALCAECGAEYEQTAQADATPKTEQCLGNSRDTKGLPQPRQLDWGFQLSVPLSCDFGPCSCVFMMMVVELTPWSFSFSGFSRDGKFESSAFLGLQGSQECASGGNGAGQSWARLTLKMEPPPEEWGV